MRPEKAAVTMDCRSYPDDKKVEAEVGETTTATIDTSSPPISSTASQERDDNYEFYKQNRGIGFTAEEAKKVLRKIDIQILPVLIVTYTLQYLDKNSINYAAVYGLKEGTGLKGQDYSWLSAFSEICRPSLEKLVLIAQFR